MKYIEEAKELLNKISLDGLTNYMDDEIRKDVHSQYAPCDELTFVAAYLEKHFNKYGELLNI